MKTGVKVALGCLIAAVGAVVIGVVGVMMAGYWVKQKVTTKLEAIQGDQKQIDTYLQRAKANAFTPAPDGVITEAQLLKFLDVRKRIFAVYQKYGKEFEQLDKDHPKADAQASFQIFKSMMGAFNEVRLTNAQALAEVGMNPAEYAFLVGAVYRTYYAHEIAKSTGGKSASQVLEEAAKAVESASPSPEAGESLEARQAREEAQRQFRDGLRQVQEGAKALDVPPANLALFKKYEIEIKKYVMPGLELIDAIGAGLTQ